MEFKVWGLTIEETSDGNYLLWVIKDLKKPFYLNGKYQIGLNEKLLKKAYSRGVGRIYIEGLEGKYISLPINMKVEKLLKEKEKRGEVVYRKSKFNPEQELKIYMFKI